MKAVMAHMPRRNALFGLAADRAAGSPPLNPLLAQIQMQGVGAQSLEPPINNQSGAFGYPLRAKLFDGEDNYFRENKQVSGMAAEDNSIILNPYSPLSKTELDAVARNEGARLYMRERGITPRFEVTPEQQKFFVGSTYAENPDAMRQTIAARIMSGDPSAQATPEQIAEVQAIFGWKP